MKKKINDSLICVSFLILSLGAQSAHAVVEESAPNRSRSVYRGVPQKSTIRYSHAAPEAADSSSIAVGISTLQNNSLTALFSLSPVDSLQFFFSIPSTYPSFSVGALGVYKRSLVEHGSSGLHVGAGFGVGSVTSTVSGVNLSSFGLSILGLAGVHFEIPGVSHLKIHFDAGPAFAWNSASGSNLSVGGLSSALGLSLLYSL
jgi:hypothetical protein